MNLHTIIESVVSDTFSSVASFRPELVLCATIVLILLLRIVRATSAIDSFWIALVGSAVALGFAAPWRQMEEEGDAFTHVVSGAPEYYIVGPQQAKKPDGTIKEGTKVVVLKNAGSYTKIRGRGIVGYVASDSLRTVYREPLFTGMLVYDSLTIYFRVLLLSFVVLLAIFTRISGIPDREAAPDFYVLVLGATLGMCLMASANHLLIVFLGIEMASVPSYALAGLLKGRRQSSEAALKYAVYGAGTAGVMLYGISLLGGVLGSVHIPTMALRLASLLGSPAVTQGQVFVLALGALTVMVGVAFKLSAVPFHFWCPDVFEGASAEVDAFLSVASKAAALALLVRVALGLSYIPGDPTGPISSASFSVSDSVTQPSAATNAEKPAEQAPRPSPARATPSLTAPTANVDLAPVRDFASKLLALVAVISCTFGNLAAYGQTNIKRLLAYSTIAHAGYMMMPVAAAIALAGTDPRRAEEAIGALTFYIGIYLFMNLGAFAVVAFLRNVLRSEEIADYAGLIHRAPIVVVCFSLMLFSLIGLPPLAGFNGKFLIFAALVDARLWTVLVIGGVNTAISLFYYLRVVKIMTIDPEPSDRLPISISFIPGTFVVALTLPIILLGIWWNGMNYWVQAAAAHLLS